MQYLNETGLNAFWKKIKDWTRSKHGQSIEKGTATEAGIPLNLMNGADTPIALGNTVTITKDDITKLGIPASDTKYTHPVGGAPSKAVGLYKFSTDATSHVAGVAAVTKADISPLESDPTVPAWAKEATKPDYDTDEIESASASFPGDTLTVVIDRLDSAVEINAAAIAKIFVGTVVSTICDTQYALSDHEARLFTKEEFTANFGRPFDPSKDYVGAMNADGAAFNGFVESATYFSSEGIWVGVPGSTNGNSIRLNYLVVLGD